MKLYNKIGIFAAGALLLSSCAVNDPFANNMEIGAVVPTVTWELSSSVCTAGNEASFLGKYYTTAEGVSIDHSEVWAMTTCTESAAATQKLISSPAYTKTVTATDTVRGFHLLQSFPHSMATLEGQEYHLNASFPTSRTLGAVTWTTPTEWDADKFAMYYPESFKTEFCDYMVEKLTNDSTYFSSLRSLFVYYDFTQEQFDAVNAAYEGKIKDFEPLPFAETSTDKDALWFAYDTETVDHYYYTTLEGEITVEHEIATVEEGLAAGIAEDRIYPVYKAPHWVFCRYSDDTGGAIVSVRAEYMPMWKELVALVPFEAWIYDSSETCYAVEFTRKYSYIVQFKVIDTVGNTGKDSTDQTIDLN